MATLFLYRILTVLLSPVIGILLAVRWLRGKEDKNRFGERLGRFTRERPTGRLVWMHGASVGECLSMLPLVKKLLDENKDLSVMVTSGTVTSADLMAKRLPKGAFHHYIPVDFPWATKRFVQHWKPDLVLWFESDFWPNMLSSVQKAGTPLVLLNGRISDKSFARWQKASGTIGAIQNLFTMSFGQTKEDARRLKVLGAKDVVSVGNLKFAATYPPFDFKELKAMKKTIGQRPCWCMASTHYNEEEMGVRVHKTIVKEYKGLLTILAPRHPNRADEIEKMCIKNGLTVARRSRGESITSKVDIYLSDTIGEMGLIYQLSPYVFVGGSLIPFGGQNMLEPMRLHRAVMIGPHAFNFREIVAQAKKDKALKEVSGEKALTKQLLSFLMKPADAEKMAVRAEKMAISEMNVLDRIYDVLHQRFGV